MWYSPVFLLAFLVNLILFIACQEDEENAQQPKQKTEQEKMSEMMKHDGVKRVIVATEKNIEKVIRKNDLVVMLFWIDNGKDVEKVSAKDYNLLEVIAQIFLGKKVVATTCEIAKNQQFAKDVGVKYTGMIKIFNRGRSTTYYGQRSTDVMLPYMAKMMSYPIMTIGTKSDKKTFDANDLPKVIAYVEEKGKQHRELYNAALNFQPMIPFYAVHDAKLAKMLHLKKQNSLQLVKPYEKAAMFSSKKGITEETVAVFVNQHKRQRITKMRLENIHEVWAIDGTGFVVPVFAVTTTEDGNHFFSLVKSLAKHFEKNRNVSFVWIDPQPFPSMVEYWRRSFNIDPTKPTLGVVNVHKQTSAWYPRPTEEDTYKQTELKKWINNVLNGKVDLKPITYQEQNEAKEEEEEVVDTEGKQLDGKEEL